MKCPIHDVEPIFNRDDYDGFMRDLPESQAGAARHKCAYCAFALGYSSGLRHVEEKLEELRNP